MKVSLLFCAVMLLAASASAQCTHEPVGKPLRIRLIMEDGTPVIVQNVFLNGLRSIPDVVVRTDSTGDEDVVVYVFGSEIKDTLGNVMGNAWFHRVYRYWHCGTGVPLEESFERGLAYATLSEAEVNAREDVAEINIKAFEKLRQEREASKRP